MKPQGNGCCLVICDGLRVVTVGGSGGNQRCIGTAAEIL